MGITSKVITYKLFKDRPYFGVYKDYDYKDLAKKIGEIYVEHQVKLAENRMNREKFNAAKRSKFND